MFSAHVLIYAVTVDAYSSVLTVESCIVAAGLNTSQSVTAKQSVSVCSATSGHTHQSTLFQLLFVSWV